MPVRTRIPLERLGGLGTRLAQGWELRELKRTVGVLQVRAEMLAVTLESIGDAVLTTDALGLVTGLNPAAERYTGWTQADAAGLPVAEVFCIVNQETRLPSPIPVQETLARGAVMGLAALTVLLARDGAEYVIADSCAPIRDHTGRVIGAVMVFRDVTEECAVQARLRESLAERARVEDQLRWTEQSFRMMVESVVDCAIVMLDPEGRVVSWNSGAERIKGYRADEIIGQHCSRFYTPEDIAKGVPALNLAAAAKGRFQEEGWRARKDGSRFWANAVFTAIRDGEGRLRGFAKLTQDRTERRQVEGELKRAQAVAEAANLAKSTFLSGMSHELRSPLNAILGFAQLMESATPPLEAIHQDYLAQILKAGWHLLLLINDVLDLAKVESGQVPMVRVPVPLEPMLLECRAMIEPQAQGKAIRLGFPEGPLPPFVHADRTRLKQVLLNLLSNAVKYNVHEGLIEVTAREGRPGMVRIGVRDSGKGLTAEQISQLFQPFNRLDQENGGEEGTGIGLVVAKRLVELMGGRIGVESTPGVGSEFWFELPSASAPEPVRPGPEGSEEAGGAQPGAPRQTVLYVEDNPANQKLVEQILSRHPDLAFLCADNALSGLEQARQAQPDLILMDINLPGINGFEAMARLRADPATAHIPVLAVSANAMASDLERGLAAGFHGYVTKPIKVGDFTTTIYGALAFARQQRARREADQPGVSRGGRS